MKHMQIPSDTSFEQLCLVLLIYSVTLTCVKFSIPGLSTF